MAFEDALNLLSSSDIKSILIFGGDAFRFFNFMISTMDRVLILSELSQPLDMHFKDSQYIVECYVLINPCDIFKFTGKGIDSIIYLPSMVFLQGRGDCFMPLHKFSVNMFLERIKMILKICRFLCLKLLLIFKGGMLSIDDDALIFSPKFLVNLTSLFDVIVYCESNCAVIV